MKFRTVGAASRVASAVLAATPVLCLCLGLACHLPAQQTPVTIAVEACASEGEIHPVWAYFGYDEPNYTYAPNGQKLLKELRALTPSSVPVYVRVHNLLTTGDGSSSLKWGSTNAYTEDAHGSPVYDWRVVDRIFDTFRDTGATPLVEVGFMPEALSTHPEPYRHDFPKGSVFTGWTYPPKDYAKWQELVYQFAGHLRARYGDQAIKTWLWEIWNEPDIDYWRGTRDEFFKLYDYGAQGILRAIPEARVGGPDTTGAAGKNAGEYLQAFLEHCARGKNDANGGTGAPLAFISTHPKGSPHWRGDHVQMGLGPQLLSVKRGFEIVAEFPEYRTTPIILGEWDPEGCAACSAKNHPENAYRNGELYAAYTAEAMKDSIALAKSTGVNLQGLVSWSFEFEDQPPFEGFRELATNGIDKPVLNAFRMFGMLGTERVKLTSSAALPPGLLQNPGGERIEGVDGIATSKNREIGVLLWNYKEENIPGPGARIDLKISGLPASAKKVSVEEFRIDRENSNAYAAWQKMGEPHTPTAGQFTALESAGRLKRTASETTAKIENGTLRRQLDLPQQGLILLRAKW